MAQPIVTTSLPDYQAYQILYIGFIVAFFLAGLDKFTHVLTGWDHYLAPVGAGLLPVCGATPSARPTASLALRTTSISMTKAGAFAMSSSTRATGCPAGKC